MKKKRVFAIFMSALLLLNSVPFINPGLEVKADDEAVKINSINFEIGVAQTEFQDAPSKAETLSKGMVYMDLDMDAQDTYTLSYLYDPVTRVDFEVKVETSNLTATGKFKIFKYNSGAWVQQPLKSADFMIYSSNPAARNFVPADEYIRLQPSPNNGSTVTKVGTDDYYFEFPVNRGSCIRIGSHEVYFLLERVGTNFRLNYTAGHLFEGFIYNFYFYNTGKTVISRAQAYMGINSERVDFIPIVSDRLQAVSTDSNFTTFPLKNSEYILDYTNSVYPVGKLRTIDYSAVGGTEEDVTVGMAIRFDEPIEYNFENINTLAPIYGSAGRAYTGSTNMNIEVTMNMDFRYGNQTGESTLVINNILELGSKTGANIATAGPGTNQHSYNKTGLADSLFNVPLASNSAKTIANYEVSRPLDNLMNDINKSSYASFLSGTGGTAKLTTTPRRVQVLLNNLVPSLYFTPVSIQSRSYNISNEVRASASRVKTQTIDRAKAFTFMDYEIFNYGTHATMTLTPYSGVEGNYTLSGSNSDSIHYRSSNNTTVITWSLSDLITATYQIIFAPWTMSGQNINWLDSNVASVYSEKSRYNVSNAPIDLGQAKEFEVKSYDLKPDESIPGSSYGDFGKLDLNLIWQIANESAMDSLFNKATKDGGSELVLKYSLLKSLTGNRDNEGSTRSDYIYGYAYFVITKNPNGTYSATYTIYKYKDAAWEQEFLSDDFDPDDNTDNILAGNKNLDAKMTSDNDSMYSVNIQVSGIPAEKVSGNANTIHDETKFHYENIYFLSVETLSGTTNFNKKSNYDSMSLSVMVKTKVPPLVNLQLIPESIDKDNFEKFSVRWEIASARLKDYFDSITYDYNDASYKFNVYISTNEALIKELGSKNEDALKQYLANAGAGNVIKTPYDVVDKGKGDVGFKFEIDKLDEADLYDFRDGKILAIEGLLAYKDKVTTSIGSSNTRWTLDLNGLDENQTYYIYVGFEIDHPRKTADPDDVEIVDTVNSVVSTLLAVTTGTDANPPTGEDMKPAAPQIEIIDVNVASATVYWPHAATAQINEKVYYEVIRTKARRIGDKYVNAYDLKMPELYADLVKSLPDTEIVVLQTPSSASDLSYFIYDATTKQPVSVPASDTKFQFSYSSEGITLIDNTLTSNEIYFYYVRTVKITKSGNALYSVFDYDTCTTNPVAPPIKLRVLEKSEVEHDPKTEIVINFDAPLPNTTFLGTDYNLIYAIKADNGEYVEYTMTPSLITSKAIDNAADEYKVNITYKITGLSPNTMYSIKVKLFNIKTNDISSWSNTVITRTEVDADDYFNDKSSGSWLDYYKQMLQLLVKDTYWTLQDSSSRFSAVYRPSMFGSVVSQTTDARIVLPKGSAGASQFIYYIPASSLMAANGANKGFVSSFNNVEVIISPKTVNTETNETVLTILEKINKKQIADYYVCVTIEYLAYNQNVGGNPPLSENIVLNIQLVGATEKAAAFDSSTLAQYLSAIDTELARKDIQDEITKMVADGAQSENIIKYLTNLSKSFKNGILSTTNSNFRSGLSGTSVVSALDASVIISLKTADVTANATGYRWENQWTPQNTIAFGTGKAFYTGTPGSFIFAGLKIVMEGAENMPGALTAYTIISKYSLTDFLGSEGQINLDALASRSAVLGSAARMMGAPKGSDAVEFLKSKGYIISGAGLDSSATLQESIYVVMTIYEARTKVKVETLQIKNYTVLSNVTGINDRYKPYIRVAHELGIVNAENMIPRATLNIRQFLDMLTALDKRANL